MSRRLFVGQRRGFAAFAGRSSLVQCLIRVCVFGAWTPYVFCPVHFAKGAGDSVFGIATGLWAIGPTYPWVVGYRTDTSLGCGL